MRISCIVLACLLGMISSVVPSARAQFDDAGTSISDAQLKYYLQYPRLATAARYGLKDDIGNTMDSPSVLQLAGQPYKYVAAYHTPYAVGVGSYRFRVNLAGSNDLLHWKFLGMLADNASMPRLGLVRGSSWIVLAHEQWMGRGAASSGQSRIAYQLFYSGADLVNRTARALWVQQSFLNRLNGTPSFYDLRQDYCGAFRCVTAQIGFHYWSGLRDTNASVVITRLFDPRGGTYPAPIVNDLYLARFAALGVTGNLGQRDTITLRAGRYSVQEGNIGRPAASWDKWRIFLYRFTEPALIPSGEGMVTPIAPETPAGSTSFGNPSIRVVDDPAGSGRVLVISYFLFAEGAKGGEAGSLLYYFRLDGRPRF